MKYATLCSGIGSEIVAWQKLGWECVGVAEIDPHANSVLSHHYPAIPNYGDMRNVREEIGAADLISAGTPCQSFSIAGLRGGLDDGRGELSIKFVQILAELQPRWFVWENVLGAFSSNRGEDFKAFIKALAQCGYSFAWRVLDAQYVRTQSYPRAVPQRRRRIFLVGHLGDDWRPPCAVLFEPEGLRGYPAPERRPKEKVAGTVCANLGKGSWRIDEAYGNLMTPYKAYGSGSQNEAEVSGSLVTKCRSDYEGEVFLSDGVKLRRLTPLECERLMGLPDNYTLVPHTGNKKMADSPRYRLVGNSIAVNCIEWIGDRIKLWESI